MYLIHTKTGKNVEAIIEPLTLGGLKNLQKSKRFGFDWTVEAQNEVYQLRLTEGIAALGLVSLIDVPREWRIEISLIEASIENVGKTKEYERIIGCLIAFACEISAMKGYDGFISLIPKTALVEHYITKYGFKKQGAHLVSEHGNASLLIKKCRYHEL